ncbi:unnamed protein product [Amoebophrya sp. A25]|nr:unnamed protein product [Amoebophrya sp. A25]|eukprot:GSA25T00019740001.1
MNVQKCPDAQKKTMFHGTTAAKVPEILEKGLPLDYDRWGAGVYLTEELDLARSFPWQTGSEVDVTLRVVACLGNAWKDWERKFVPSDQEGVCEWWIPGEGTFVVDEYSKTEITSKDEPGANDLPIKLSAKKVPFGRSVYKSFCFSLLSRHWQGECVLLDPEQISVTHVVKLSASDFASREDAGGGFLELSKDTPSCSSSRESTQSLSDARGITMFSAGQDDKAKSLFEENARAKVMMWNMSEEESRAATRIQGRGDFDVGAAAVSAPLFAPVV